MSRAHIEIAHLIRRLGRLLDDMSAREPDDDDLIELRRLLYSFISPKKTRVTCPWSTRPNPRALTCR